MRRHGSTFVFYDKSAGGGPVAAAAVPDAPRQHGTGYPVPKKPLKRRYGAAFSIFDDFAGSPVESGAAAESGLAVAHAAAMEAEANADADDAPGILRVNDHDAREMPDEKRDEAKPPVHEHSSVPVAAQDVSTTADPEDRTEPGPENPTDAAPSPARAIPRDRRKTAGKTKYGSTFVFYDKSAGPDPEVGPVAPPPDPGALRQSAACKSARKPGKRRYGSTFSIFDDFTDPAVVPAMAPEVLREEIGDRKEPEGSEDDESALPSKPKRTGPMPRTVSADEVASRRSPGKIPLKSPEPL